MNPLYVQIANWFLSGLLVIKDDNAATDEFREMFKVVLSENRPLNEAEQARVDAYFTTERAALANA